jgi:UPF0176 protein
VTSGKICAAHGIKGTILIACEGINATVSGDERGLTAFLAALGSDPRLSNLEIEFSETGAHPFQRLKVKIKREIVTFGCPDRCWLQPVRVEPESWNALISEPDVLLIDTRNYYEVEVGTFEGGRNLKTRAFSEFPDFVRGELYAAAS